MGGSARPFHMRVAWFALHTVPGLFMGWGGVPITCSLGPSPSLLVHHALCAWAAVVADVF